MNKQDSVVITVGNPSRGDDGAGPMVANLLRQAITGETSLSVPIIECFQLVPELIDDINLFARCFIVDASRQQRNISLSPVVLPAQPGTFSHQLSPQQLLWLLKQIYPQSGVDLFALEIPASQFDLGTPLTGSTQQFAAQATALLLTKLNSSGTAIDPDHLPTTTDITGRATHA